MLAIGIPAIRVIAPTFALAAVTMISGYMASGLQDGVTNMVGAVLRQFVPLIPIALLMAKTGGIGSVWYAFWISELCGTAYAILRMRMLLKKKADPMEAR